MFVLKCKYHIKAFILKIFYKIIYRNNFVYGKNLNFRDYFKVIIEPNSILEIGNNVFFNNGCSVNVHKEVKIGDDCIFGENVKIYDHNHLYKNKQILIKDQGFLSEPIFIGNNCWIGSNVVILKGVSIGDNCIIGAGNTIYKSVKNNSVIINEQQQKNLGV